MYSAANICCSAGDADRYLRQEHKLIERYYNGPESDVERGLYVGGHAFALDGKVVGAEFKNLLDARNPDGESLYRCSRENRRLGYDLTFSPDKSVSLLWARSDESTRRQLEETVFKATKDTLLHIKEHVLEDSVRRGKGGEIRESPQDLTFAVFQHGSSRAGDPQLHHHAVLLNTAQRQDGTWGALEAKAIYMQSGEIRKYFDLALASHLKRDFGIDVEVRKEGIRIPGISQDLIDEFSKRRNEIWKIGEERGMTSAEARQRYTLDTRESKKATERELLPQWQEEFDKRGFTREKAQEILQWRGYDFSVAMSPEVKELEVAKRIDDVFAKFGERSLALTENELRRTVAEKFVGFAIPAEFPGLCEQVLADKRLLELAPSETGLRRFTTENILEQERKLSRDAHDIAERQNHPMDPEKTRSILIRRVGEGMSIEQAEATRRTLEKGDLAIIYGAAGTGKSYSLSALREIAAVHGYSVRGLAPTGKAAENLEHASEIPSKTIHKYLHDLGKGRDKFEAKDIIVVDEAGMIGTEKTKLLIEHAKQEGAKLVFVGDDRQLSPIDAGTPFSKLKEEFGAAEIVTMRRQNESWQREAAEKIRVGNVNAALCLYEDHSKIRHATSWDHLRQELVSTYLKDREAGKTQLILSPTNEMRRDINDDIRNARFGEKELLRKYEVKISTTRGDGSLESKEFTKGDRIYFLRNDNELRVKNGTLGTIEAIHRTGRGKFEFEVRLDDERQVRFSTEKYRAIDHGYAATVHKSQGDTVDKSYVVVTKSMGQEEAYVSLTRHREEAKIYCATELVHGARHEYQREEASIYQKKLNMDAMTKAMGETHSKRESLTLKEEAQEHPRSLSVKANSPEFGIYATLEHKKIVQELETLPREEITEKLYQIASDPLPVQRSLQAYPVGERADYQHKAQEILKSRNYSQEKLTELREMTLSKQDGVRPVLTDLERRQHYEKVQDVVYDREKAKVFEGELRQEYMTPGQKRLIEELSRTYDKERQIELLKGIALEKSPQSPTFGIPNREMHAEALSLLKEGKPQECTQWAQEALGRFNIGKEGRDVKPEWAQNVHAIHEERRHEIRKEREWERSITLERSREHGISR